MTNGSSRHDHSTLGTEFFDGERWGGGLKSVGRGIGLVHLLLRLLTLTLRPFSLGDSRLSSDGAAS